QLPLGSTTILAAYTASPAAPVSASVAVNVTPAAPASRATPAINGLSNGASFKGVYALGMVLSVFGSQLAPATSSASSVPLPLSMAAVAVTVNGAAPPPCYVAPGQLNIQIPYKTASGQA